MHGRWRRSAGASPLPGGGEPRRGGRLRAAPPLGADTGREGLWA